MSSLGSQPQDAGVSVRAFPWDLYASIALRGLHWSPQTFWRSTPREVSLAFAASRHSSGAFDRAAFDALQLSFPDEGQSQEF